MKPSTKDRRPVLVRVSPSAFFDLIVAATESAMIAPEFNDDSFKILSEWQNERQNRSLRTGPLPGCLVFSDTGLEFAGCLLGTTTENEAQVIYSVERAVPVTALRSDDWVAQSELSPLLIDDLAAAANTGWQVIADVHSHPFIDTKPAEVHERRYYAPSPTDKTPLPYPGFHFSLIVTVSMGGRKKIGHCNSPGPLHQSRVGDFEIWLYAHLRSRRANGRPITLEVPQLPAPAARRTKLANAG
ncbi:hypothetical protein MUO32_21075 [Shinella sp. CPCC 101442]|uniref:hypothetical protein n=1 Tax=Shinella sp. CPCC 101442 TaxID=2932265 RepID=UPI0021534FB3|nr:hypothetical protein [Shinella sp. CPCC 101442]MCR6501534.1 hypothetical protein [Shinella sp. CPCC 101442]